MKLNKLLTVAALSTLSVFAVSASAEEYQGVLQVHSSASRADVRAQGRVAARSANPYAEGASAGVPVALAGEASRATVRTGAVAAARAGDLYAEGASSGVESRSASAAARNSMRRAAL
jgi:hypothetical protein